MKRSRWWAPALMIAAAGTVWAQNKTTPNGTVSLQEPAAITAPAEGTTKKTSGFTGILAELDDTAASQPELSIFVEILEKSGIGNAAFEDGVTLLVPAIEQDISILEETITDYVINGRLTTGDLFIREYVTTLSGKQLPVQIQNNQFMINGVAVTGLDSVSTDSVVVHKLNGLFTDALIGLK